MMDRRADPHCSEINPASFSTISKEDESDFSAAVLHYINQMLMEEEDMEKSCMFHDSLALQAAEKSFYEAIDDKYPSPSSTHDHLHNYPNVQIPDHTNLSDYSISGGNNYGISNSTESHWSGNVLHSNSTSMNHMSNFTVTNNEFFGTSMDGFYYSTSTLFSKSGIQCNLREAPQVENNTRSDEGVHLISNSKGRKNHQREDEAELQEGRTNKHSAVSMDDTELSELFDKVLLGSSLGRGPNLIMQQQDEKSNKCGGGKSRVRKQVHNNEEVVDLRTLLMLCAQAISSDNHSTAIELLKQIKEHSSATGDGTQRLAHCFGNALEARLAGTGTQIYSALSSKRISFTDMIRAYQMHSSACPFNKLAIIYAINSIWSVAKDVETLHIVDFGINYGFKWPALIHRMSKRAGGAPKLRITGIELPQPGFRPEERVHETGRRLARYCKRFNVPFEFNAIVQKKWENIKVEDLKIVENELVAVNCMFRFENLLDETVVLNNPKDAVLKLISKANPSIFVHSIVNGCYDAPFFVTRFREALFHYSALFDILDNTVAREDPTRLMFEKEIFGKEVMNVIACEGCERVERPETYKQWQIRNMKIGFRQLPLDHQNINKLKGRLRDDKYHSDFTLEIDGNWVLQGWKGRILHASSCWVPA